MTEGWMAVARATFEAIGFSPERVPVLIDATAGVWDTLGLPHDDRYEERELNQFSVLIAAIASVEDFERTDAFFNGPMVGRGDNGQRETDRS